VRRIGGNVRAQRRRDAPSCLFARGREPGSNVAGQIIVVQRKIMLNYSNLAIGVAYDHIHAESLNVAHAREIIVNARVSQRTFGSGTACALFVRGVYPDADDAGDIVGADLGPLAINFVTLPAVVPGVATSTQVNAIPAMIRIGTRFTQSASAVVALMLGLSITIVVRE
jgi:hypothetical protein